MRDITGHRPRKGALILMNERIQGTPKTMYAPDSETDKNQHLLPTSVAEPLVNQSVTVPILNANNVGTTTTCTMCREDLVQILEKTKYGATNQAMFNAYFQAGSSPPLCIACMRPLQHHQSRMRQQPNTSWQGLGGPYSGMAVYMELLLSHSLISQKVCTGMVQVTKVHSGPQII